MKVLIAEDDMTSRIILDSILKKWGFTPVLTCNGKEAWEVMQSKDAPRLAVLDWQMPEMNGIEVCQKIREIDTSEPPYLILLTSKDEKKDIVKGLEAGANDFISKPYDNKELQARINVGQRMVKLQSELGEAYRALEHEAMHDPLTNIFNRRAIMDLLEKEIARAKREKTGLCVGVCDLDYFKKVNDTYGHKIGDDVLIAFTRFVTDKLRINDHVGRIGGEEFLIVVSGSKDLQKDALFERICEYVRNSEISTEKGNVSITVSIGVSQYTGVENSSILLATADTALYHAKKLGRDRVVCADDI
ncbi:MAG: diguanylate cyclase [Desulfobacula sp.]|jgi:two-component system cell cycle response regulator|nr:diguanylate cyclase [Desulfobacula sp.]